MLRRLFQFFYSFFFERIQNPWDSDLECKIDIEQMIKNLQLDHKAKKSAKHELPKSNSRTPDGTELRIRTLIQKQMAELTHSANQKLIGYNTTLSNSDLNSDHHRIQNLAENAKLKLNSRLAEAEQQLSVMKDDLERSTTSFRLFQKKNQREADAEYPDSQVFHYSLVLLILLVESAANGFFFAKGSEFGMLGGINQSLIVAILNIVPAFLFAGMVCLRYIHHVEFLKRTTAIIVLVLYVGWVLLFNLCVAHYRDLLDTEGQSAVTLVINHMIASPFGLADLNSWLLLIMGIFFAVIAMVDGYKSDDAYPGYGRIQRLNDEIRENYDVKCRELAQEATAIRHDFLEELQSIKDNVKSTFSHFRHLAEAKPTLAAKHRDCLEILAQAGDSLIHHYRTINAMHRKTSPPAYFSKNWKPEKSFALIGAYNEENLIKNQQKLYERFPGFIQKTSNELEEVYSAFFNRLQRIEPAIQPAVATNDSEI